MYYIKTKNKSGQYVSNAVPKAVYEYVKQLEMCIKYPEDSELKEVYSERFPKNPQRFKK